MKKLKKKISVPNPPERWRRGTVHIAKYEEIQIDDERDVSLSSLEDLNNKDTKNRQRIL